MTPELTTFIRAMDLDGLREARGEALELATRMRAWIASPHTCPDEIPSIEHDLAITEAFAGAVAQLTQRYADSINGRKAA